MIKFGQTNKYYTYIFTRNFEWINWFAKLHEVDSGTRTDKLGMLNNKHNWTSWFFIHNDLISAIIIAICEYEPYTDIYDDKAECIELLVMLDKVNIISKEYEFLSFVTCNYDEAIKTISNMSYRLFWKIEEVAEHFSALYEIIPIFGTETKHILKFIFESLNKFDQEQSIVRKTGTWEPETVTELMRYVTVDEDRQESEDSTSEIRMIFPTTHRIWILHSMKLSARLAIPPSLIHRSDFWVFFMT